MSWRCRRYSYVCSDSDNCSYSDYSIESTDDDGFPDMPLLRIKVQEFIDQYKKNTTGDVVAIDALFNEIVNVKYHRKRRNISVEIVEERERKDDK